MLIIDTKSKIIINLKQITVINSGNKSQCSNNKRGHLLEVLYYGIHGF